METEEKKVELLEKAFNSFTTTSLHLEKYYKFLEDQVRQLRSELENKNRALKISLEEKEAFREQAERNHRLVAIGETAARIAHELRNPLGSIQLFASLLAKHLESDPEKQKWAEYLQTAVRAMDYALSNLLHYTRKPKPHFRKTEIAAIIEDAWQFARPMIEQNGIRYRPSDKRRVGSIDSDEDLLRQILLNLILNAVDAMPHGGELCISAEPYPERSGPDRAPEGIVLSVSDTGTGIPDEVLSRIFDPFFTTKERGTGLGLAIVHNAVTALGGTIQVRSQAGPGTLFRLIFPSVTGKVEPKEAIE